MAEVEEGLQTLLLKIHVQPESMILSLSGFQDTEHMGGIWAALECMRKAGVSGHGSGNRSNLRTTLQQSDIWSLVLSNSLVL